MAAQRKRVSGASSASKSPSDLRQDLIEATISALDSEGPVQLRVQEICAQLNVSKALVNYHFGGRDGLMAEAVATCYERYVDELWAASSAENGGPQAQLLAWVNAQVDWTRRHPGVAMVLNFPRFFDGAGNENSDELVNRFRAAGAQNHANLRVLVAAARAEVRKGKKSNADITDEQALAAIVGWATLGMSIWSAGEHLPTHGVMRDQFETARKMLSRRLVALISA